MVTLIAISFAKAEEVICKSDNSDKSAFKLEVQEGGSLKLTFLQSLRFQTGGIALESFRKGEEYLLEDKSQSVTMNGVIKKNGKNIEGDVRAFFYEDEYRNNITLLAVYVGETKTLFFGVLLLPEMALFEYYAKMRSFQCE
jgi:hypothetical protein